MRQHSTASNQLTWTSKEKAVGQSICAFEGCDRPHKAKGLCETHYAQHKSGKPLKPVGSTRINTGKTCYGPLCDRPAEVKGLCRVHARQVRNGRDLTPIESRRKAAPGSPCEFTGCDNPREARGLCSGHYAQLIRGKELSTLRSAPGADLSQFWANVPVGGPAECWTWKGSTLPSGYGTARINGVNTTVHRHMWILKVGPIPEDAVIDHLCSNRSCVNPRHLRVVEQQINAADRAYFPRNTSGYRNVYYDKSRDKWVGSFGHYGKIQVGRFDTPEEAAEAVRKKKLEIYGYEFRDSLDGTL